MQQDGIWDGSFDITRFCHSQLWPFLYLNTLFLELGMAPSLEAWGLSRITYSAMLLATSLPWQGENPVTGSWNGEVPGGRQTLSLPTLLAAPPYPQSKDGGWKPPRGGRLLAGVTGEEGEPPGSTP